MSELPTYAGEKVITGYEVGNLNFAATLMCLGKKVLGAKPNPKHPHLSIFIFEQDDEIKGLHKPYTNGALLVEPRLFTENVRTLKDISNNLAA